MLNIGHGIPHSSCVLLGFRLYVSSAAAGLQYTPPVDFMWHASRLMIRIALQRAHFELTGSDAALHAQNPSPRKCAPRCSAGRAARHPATLACAPPPRPRPPRTPRAREAAARDRALAFCFRRCQRRRQHRSARDVRAHVGPAGVYPADDC